MLRWSYLFPRLMLLLLLCLFLRFGLGYTMRQTLILGGQSALGAKVDVGTVMTSFVHGDVQLADLEVTNPQQPLKNLFQATGVALHLDSRELLYKRYVFETGKVTGLQLNTDRQQSGELPGNEPKPNALGQQIKTRIGDMGQQWWDQLSDRLETDWQKQFVSIRVAEEMMARWPREYQRLEQEAKSWEDRIGRIKAIYDELKANPLQEVAYYERAWWELESVRRDLPKLKQDVVKWKQQAMSDHAALEQARRQDTQTIQQTLRMEFLEPQTLTNYLLGEQTGERLTTMLSWMQQGRQLMKTVLDKPALNDADDRGRTIRFADERNPEFLVRRLLIDGTSRLGSQEIGFQGVVKDLTHQQRVHGSPLLVQIATSGAVQAKVQAVLDQTGKRPTEQLVIDYPRLAQPRQKLGDANRFSVTVAPGTAHLWAQVDSAGDEIVGRIVLKQDQVDLTAQLASGVGGERLQRSLQSALSQIDKIHTVIDLSGDPLSPRVQLASNLGNELSESLSLLAQQELEHQKTKLMGEADKYIDQQWAVLESKIAEQEDKLRKKLNLGSEQLDFFKQEIGKRVGAQGGKMIENLLGDRLDIKKLLRR